MHFIVELKLFFLNKKVGKKLMEYVGAASGATLGFIHGNMPGAYIGGNLGYKLGKKYSNEMSTSQTKRGRSKSRTPSGGSRASSKRKLSTGSNMSISSSRRSSLLSSIGTVRARKRVTAHHGQGSMVTTGKKIVDQFKDKKKKKVKIPKLLRKQVTQILDSKEVYGYWRGILYGGTAQVETPSFDQQAVFALPGFYQVGGGQGTKIQGLLFSPEYYQMVAARLFNGRLKETNAFGEVYTEQGIVAGKEWRNFDQLVGAVPALKLSVESTYAVIKMKNNSVRTLYLKMYVAKPKYQRASGTMNNIEGHAVNDWITQLSMEGQAEVSGKQYPGDSNTRSLAVNIDNTVKHFSMYACPTKCKSLQAMWSFDITEIVMEPGQTYKTIVRGDAMELDYSKMVHKSQTSNQGLIFNDIQKFSRCVFFTGVPEMAYSTANDGTFVPGAYRCKSQDANQRLLFETELHCKIKMPEPTGGVLPWQSPEGIATQGRIFTNNSRKRAYCFDIFSNTNGQALNPFYTQNVDDNNPIGYTIG